VTLTIYSINGQKISTLINVFQAKGYHKIKWDATNLGSGIYMVEIKSGIMTKICKTILLK